MKHVGFETEVVQRVPPIIDAVLEHWDSRKEDDRENCGGRSPSRDSRSTKGAPPKEKWNNSLGRSGLECKNTQSEAPEQTNTSSLQ